MARPSCHRRRLVIGQVPREPLGFVARDLIDILAVAAATGRVAVICAVTGLRGVGKTQLAAAYARQRIADGWRLVGWINAETRQSLVTGLAAVAGRLGVADPRGDSEKSASRLRDELQSRAGEGLLVLDNALSPEEVAPFLLANGATQVVITSTNQAFAQLGVAVDVSVFTREESVRYLCDRTGLTDVAGAAAIAAKLGDLPLALAQAATVLSNQRLSCQEYLERLRTVPTGHVLRGIRGLYPQGVAAALLDSVRIAEAVEDAEAGGIDKTGEAAGAGVTDDMVSRLLRVMAVLSPAGVRRNLLAGLADLAVQAGKDSQADSLARPYAVDEAAERCVAWSLLTWSVSGEELIMHRLLARTLRERDQEEGRWQRTVAEALDLLQPSLFPEPQALERRAEGSQLVAHVDAAWAAAMGAATVSRLLVIRRLLRARVSAVRQLAGAADLAAAIAAGTRAAHGLRGTARRGRPGDADRAPRPRCRAPGLWPAAPGPRTYERTLADWRALFGDDDLNTLETLNDYGELHLALKRPAEAIPCFEQALRGREHVLPPSDYLIFESRINLAAALSEAGG